MGRHHHRIALALIVAAASVAAPARAQDEAAGEAEPDAAQALFDEGVVHLREERYEEAARAFRRSYREAPRVETMCNLALTYDRWGDHLMRALSAFRTCARDDETGRYRGYAERRVAELERELALAEQAEPEPEPEPEPVVVEPEPAPAVADEPDHAALWVGVASGGLGLAALGAGIGLAVGSSATVDDLIAQLGPSPTIVRGSEEHDRLQGAQAQADAAVAMYVVSGVLLAASATLIVIDLVTAGASDEPAVSLAPTGSGAALRGRF